MNPCAELVLPAIRWDPERGFEPERAAIENALSLGVGGFILFGGEREAVRTLTRELQAASRHPLLIAADLERGAGQQVRGLTPLPPALALASLGQDYVAEAAQLTAREARDVGINWALAPVCDLDAEPANPIVQTRSFGADPSEAGRHVAAWISASQAEGVLACAKHFPGHGRTTSDSHAELPVVTAGRDLERDVMPFKRAVAEGVSSVMTAHVAYPYWDGSGVPATYSRAIVQDLLRRDLAFTGLVVTDALIMEGALAGQGEAEGAIRALLAGCDLLLYPRDVAAVVARIAAAAKDDHGKIASLAERAMERREAALRRALAPAALSEPELVAHGQKGEALALLALRYVRGGPARLPASVTVEVVDDDVGGPYQLPARTAFADELKRLGVELVPRGERIVLLFADVKSWKGRSALAPESRERLDRLLAQPATVVLCGHPRRLAEIPGESAVLCAWSGDEVMQRAAARRLAADSA